MGLLGGWWGVAGVGLIALFLAREVIKYMRGDVDLSARQKVLRVFGGVFLMGVLLMALFSPIALNRPEMSRQARNTLELVYWSVALAMGVLAFLMAALDMGEVSRAYARARKQIRVATLTPEDVDRLIEAEDRDRPDDPGRPPGNGEG